MTKPKVSIIIATFNSEKTLHSALDSVLNQTFQDWECIVVDGASKDGTVKIVKEFESRDSRFSHISEKDNGIYDAFNKGWRLANGEFVHYLGSDDKIMKDGFSSLFAQCPKSDDTDVIYGNIIYKAEDGSISRHRHFSHNRLPWSTFVCHQGLIMRRSVIELLDGFNDKLHIVADKDIVLRSYLVAHCRYTPTNADLVEFTGGGASSNYWLGFKESMYIAIHTRPGIRYILYTLQHYPRMWLKSKIAKLIR